MTDERLAACVRQFGTPLYVFDEGELADRVRFLRGHLPDEVGLCYAMKANSFLLPELAGRVDRFEVCSPGELRVCESVGIPWEMIVLSGVYKDEATIDDLVAWGAPVHAYTIESWGQFELLRSCAERHGRRLPVLVRLTSGNQFGVDVPVLRDIVRGSMGSQQLDLVGLQLFSGTQKDSIRRLARELAKLDDLLDELRHDLGYEARVLEYGPGLPVDYFGEGKVADEGAFLDELSDLLRGLRFGGEVVLELGRSIAASCGTYLTTVVDTKVNRGARYAIVDGGMHHLVYYGHAMAMRRPPLHLLGQAGAVGAAAGTADEDVPAWNVCGALCTTSDILAKGIPAPGLGLGSVLAFESAGAYCMTEGMLAFLSRALPKVAMVDVGGTTRLLRDGLRTDPINTPALA